MNVIEHILGTREERSSGLTRFEQSGLAKRIHPDDRSFSMGAMVQIPRQVDAPAAGLKVPKTGMTEYQLDFKAFVNVCAFHIKSSKSYLKSYQYSMVQTMEWTNGNILFHYVFKP